MPYRHVYISKRSRDCDADQVQRILEAARHNNPQHGVTGMLLCTNLLFMQLLEGAEADVLHIYDRITRDPRHFDCRVTLNTHTPQRAFSDWSMGYQDLDGDNPLAHLPGVSAFMQDPDPWRAAAEGDTALNMLLSFQQMFKSPIALSD
ncbi:MAG: BLUF domain-containing protein [Gammaproteobacteria bacterium]|nr:BLUF domain-containing protein [Gammaproteobacteria bacterium]